MSLENTVQDLLKRLEQATSRLEQVEKALASGAASASAPAAGASSSAPSAASVTEFQNLISQHITPLVALSKKLDPVLGQQAAELEKAVLAEKQLISTASQSKKPTQDVLMKLIQPINQHTQEIDKIRNSNRTSKVFNNLSALSEGVGFLGWVMVEPTPGPHVAEMRSTSEFYTNRILKEFKGVNQDQVDWVGSYIGFLKDLEKYIKQYHTTALTWNPKGGDATAAAPAAAAPAPSGSAPAPPPPPPSDFHLEKSSNAPAAKPDMSQLFSEIGKGEAVTSGLKKVTADMKSKNNPNKSSVVKASDVKTTTTSTAGSGTKTTKPPKFALESNKWAVEYQVGNKSIVIEDTDPKQTVYIYQCTDSVIQVKGKVNAITLDSCKKTAIVFENAIASCEIVNCTSIEVQVTGKVPCMSIDKTSGCQVYLSAQSLETEIVTSKSSEMNILIPGATPNDDMIELSVPEQYKTVVKGNKLVTEHVSHI
eukprot:gene5584-6951_t